MDMMSSSAAWYIIEAVAVLLFLLFIITKRRWDLLDKILFGLVTWAEREFGDGTGALKSAAVIEKLNQQIPAVILAFIGVAGVERMIERALESAKIRWGSNPKLISKPPPESF